MAQAAAGNQASSPVGAFSPEDLQFWVELLKQKPFSPVRPVEVQLLEMLSAQVDWKLDHPQAGSCFQQALKCRELSEEIVYKTRQRPDALPWIIDALQAAEERRRFAEDQLMCNDFSGSTQAFNDVSKQLEHVRNGLDEVIAAIDIRDRACRNAPYLLIWALRQQSTARARSAATGEASDSTNQWKELLPHWQSMMNDLTTLETALSGQASARSLTQWGQSEQASAKRVEDNLQFLTDKFGNSAQALEASSDDVKSLVDIENALLNPILNSDVRQRLRGRYAAILVRSAGQPTAEFKKFGDAKSTALETSKAFDEQIQQVQEATIASVDSSIKNLTEHSFARNWNQIVDPAELASLVQKAAVSDASEIQLQKSCDELLPIDGHLRRVAHSLAELPHRGDEGIRNATRFVAGDLDNFQQGLQTCYEIDRAIDDCWGDNEFFSVGDPADEPYFSRLAKLYIDRMHPYAYKQSSEIRSRLDRLSQRVAAVSQMSLQAGTMEYDTGTPKTRHSITVHLPSELPAGFAAAADRDVADSTRLIELELANDGSAQAQATAASSQRTGFGGRSALGVFRRYPEPEDIASPAFDRQPSSHVGFSWQWKKKIVHRSASAKSHESTPESKVIVYDPRKLAHQDCS